MTQPCFYFPSIAIVGVGTMFKKSRHSMSSPSMPSMAMKRHPRTVGTSLY